MNNTFSFSRFWLLAKKSFRENMKLNIILLLVFGFITALILYGNPFSLDPLPADYLSANRQKLAFWLLLAPFMVIYASTMLRGAAEKDKSTNYFMLPASTLEKYLLAFLTSTVVFFVGYTLMFYAVDALMLLVKPHIVYMGPVGETTSTLVNVFNLEINAFESIGMSSGVIFGGIIALLCSLQATFLLGSVFFKKHAFLFTMLAMLGINQLFSFVNLAVVAIFGNGFFSLMKDAFEHSLIFFPPDFSFMQPVVYVLAIIPVLFWIASYLRLKDKEA